MEERFYTIAAKILTGEASAEEESELDAILSAEPGRKQELLELKRIDRELRELIPLAAALDTDPTTVPPDRLRELRQAVRGKFEGRVRPRPGAETTTAQPSAWLDWLIARVPLGAIAGALVTVTLACGLALWAIGSKRRTPMEPAGRVVGYLVLLNGKANVHRDHRVIAVKSVERLKEGDTLELTAAEARALAIMPYGEIPITGPRRLSLPQIEGLPTKKPFLAVTNTTKRLRFALFEPAHRLTNADLLLSMRASQGIPIFSPLGETAAQWPALIWKSEPGKLYDLTIVDELDPKTQPWQISNVVSPLRFEDIKGWEGRPLRKAGLYRIRVSETAQPLSASIHTFRTVSDFESRGASSAAESLMHAYDLMTADSGRLGDVFADLVALPASVANSELALRLKLFALGQAGYRDEFESVRSELQQGSSSAR